MGVKTAALSDEAWDHVHAEIGKASGNMSEYFRSKIEKTRIDPMAEDLAGLGLFLKACDSVIAAQLEDAAAGDICLLKTATVPRPLFLSAATTNAERSSSRKLSP